MKKADWNKLMDLIDELGEDDIEEATEAMRDRRTVVHEMRGRAALKGVRVGSKVRVSDTVRPRYIAGVEVTVVSKTAKGIVAEVPPGYGRYSAGNLRLPLSMVTPV